MDDVDYVTVAATTDPRKFLACVMCYHKRDDEYVQTRCSQPLPRVAAEGLARMWAAAKQLEYR